MEITEYTINKLKDPTGILTGDRYEFLLYAKVDEEDELFTEEGIGIRVLYKIDNGDQKIVSSHLFERSTEKLLDFELEEDELQMIAAFCQEHINDEDNTTDK